MYQYNHLENVSFHEMSECLNLAFSDYSLPIHLDESQLAGLFSASGVDRALSFGAFSHGTLVGFMFNSCGLYQGRRAAFDVATGVIPSHRGNRVFANLFSLALQTMKQRGIEQYYLEVLQHNEGAVSLYKRHGFSIAREFIVLSGSAQESAKPSARVQYADFSAFDFHQAADTKRNCPSYEHSDAMLQLHPHLYAVAYIKEPRLSAWCIFAKASGQIFQLGWNRIEDLREIIQSLQTRYPHITVKNIDRSHSELLEMLLSLSFNVIAAQYEMVQNICKSSI